MVQERVISCHSACEPRDTLSTFVVGRELPSLSALAVEPARPGAAG